MNRPLCASLLMLSLGGCDLVDTARAAQLATTRSAFEVEDATGNAFSLPMPGLQAAERSRFFVGNSFFNQNWISAPSSQDTRDGLGPLFNARSCSACHFKDGRGKPPGDGEPMRTMLLRISVPGSTEHGAPAPHPTYGDQLQGEAVPGVHREADVSLSYRERPGRFADGEAFSLREPEVHIAALGHGPLGEGLQTSARVAPAMVGLGLLEAIPESALRARVDPDDEDRDGISGRTNEVFSVAAQARAFGRFGWKAEQPSVREQTAAAFVGDMGITSSLFQHENHTRAQADCVDAPRGGTPELTEQVLTDVTLYARTLAVPARRRPHDVQVRRGEALFDQAGCASCHVASWTTADDAQPASLARQTIHPYTDLLLHDMGEGLSDRRPSFAASGAEWRTAPLWGLGLTRRVNGHELFLHDGRARGLQEAVLWHGGEAARAQQTFLHMHREDRQALLAFLESL